MALKKADIVRSIQTSTGYPKDKCEEILKILAEFITGALKNGEKVLISGFGKWYVTKRKPAKFELFQGNGLPRAAPIFFKERKIVKFKYSKTLVRILNR